MGRSDLAPDERGIYDWLVGQSVVSREFFDWLASDTVGEPNENLRAAARRAREIVDNHA